jgi:acyl carrier protein
MTLAPEGHSMDVTSTATLDDVRSVLAATLGIEDRIDILVPATPLIGSLPELDSMAVVELVVALEQHFGLDISDDEVTGDVFETLGSLAAFIEAKRADGR